MPLTSAVYPLTPQLKAIRRVACLLVLLQTPDPFASQDAVREVLGPDTAQLAWDPVTGPHGRTPAGTEALLAVEQRLSQVARSQALHLPALPADFAVPPPPLTDPVVWLEACRQHLPSGAVVLCHGLHRLLDTAPALIQALHNLREPFKGSQRTCIVLAPPGTLLPSELRQDVVVLDEPLPTPQQLRQIVAAQYQYAEVAGPDEATLAHAGEALRGLHAYAAEQEVALSMTRQGLKLPTLEARIIRLLNQTPGLTVWRSGETFAQVGGLANLTGFLQRYLARNPTTLVVWIDELGDAMSGVKGDLSGVSQDVQGTLLTYTQDTQARGMILYGVAGGGKSLVAKATGGAAGCLTVRLDLGGLFGSLVGETQQKLRAVLKILDAVSDDKALYLATTNSLEPLTPQFRARFTLGTWFVDSPTAAERDAIWTLQRPLYPDVDCTPSARPVDEGWVGRDIASCARLAHDLGCPLTEATQFMVPLAVSAAEHLERVRKDAHGRYISASVPGPYRYAPLQAVAAPVAAGRRLALPDDDETPL